MNRRQAREAAFLLIFESAFHKNEGPEEIYAAAKEGRGAEEDAYVREVLFGTMEHREELEALIEKYSRGWKKERISHVSRAVMLLSAYEMLYRTDIPLRVSLNEALELVKTYDDEGARRFVNGILNAVAAEARATRNEEDDA